MLYIYINSHRYAVIIMGLTVPHQMSHQFIKCQKHIKKYLLFIFILRIAPK